MTTKKKYQKPAVSTIEIPERTAFACNNSHGCPTGSNIVGFGRGKHHHHDRHDHYERHRDCD